MLDWPTLILFYPSRQPWSIPSADIVELDYVGEEHSMWAVFRPGSIDPVSSSTRSAVHTTLHEYWSMIPQKSVLSENAMNRNELLYTLLANIMSYTSPQMLNNNIRSYFLWRTVNQIKLFEEKNSHKTNSVDCFYSMLKEIPLLSNSVRCKKNN